MLDGTGLRNFHSIGDSEAAFVSQAFKQHLASK
jgi:hypothetical protein